MVQVEHTSTWVVIRRTREGTSLVYQFKWSVHPLGCTKRTREGTSLVDLWLIKDFTRLKEISRTAGHLETGCRHGSLPNQYKKSCVFVSFFPTLLLSAVNLISAFTFC